MGSNVRILEPEVLLPPLLEMMKETDSVPLVISGGSLAPFLVHGRDTVYLSNINKPLKRGDMIFYRRDSGAYVLHRIYRVEGETYTLLGDAQTRTEPGIRHDQVLARVNAVRRKGKLLQKGSFWWDFFEKVWIRLVPLRPLLRTGYFRIKKLFK